MGKKGYDEYIKNISNTQTGSAELLKLTKQDLGQIKDHPEGRKQLMSSIKTNGIVTDRQFLDASGKLPAEVFDLIYTALGKTPGTRTEEEQSYINSYFGTQNPILGDKTKYNTVNELDNQYAKLIQDIEKTIGSRVDINYWNGKLVQQQKVWDLWINYPISRIKSLEDYKELVPITPTTQNDDTILLLGGLVHKLNLFAPANMRLGEDANTLRYYILLSTTAITNYEGIVQDIMEKVPNLTEERFKKFNKGTMDGFYVGIQMRKYSTNTSNIKYTYTSKFGPYDVLYKNIGSFSKKYIQYENNEQDLIQLETDILKLMRTEEIQPEKPALFDNYEITGQAFTTSKGVTKILTEIIKATKIKGINLKDAKLYLKLKHTLAKWFYGKKASLQKLNQDRIQRYLNKDKKDLSNVYNFFGTEMPKKKYY